MGPQGQAEAVSNAVAEDVRTLEALGYAQELGRGMSGFSNFAISLSVICILAGGVTSFHLGLSSVGGAAIGLGWPLACLFSLLFALAMAHLASAFPTAGGLYHWAAILGGRGLGWATAWFNLVGLVTVLSAINVGAYQFLVGSLGPELGVPTSAAGAGLCVQAAGVVLLTASQALLNHRGIRLTSRLTDLSGYLILGVSLALALALLAHAPGLEPGRLLRFTNYSGARGGNVWPEVRSLGWLFLLGFLLPAYTVTGFDASAHTAEETIGAAHSVPRAIVRAVLFSGLLGWFMLCAVVLAAPDLDRAAAQGQNAFYWILGATLPGRLRGGLYAGIFLAQYLCGLATLTSASRMMFAFARDEGLPWSARLRRVSPRFRTPAVAIWASCALSVAFTLYTPVYSTLTAVCTIFLYISYVLPIALGFVTYGRSWTRTGPFSLGRAYRPVAALCMLGCAVLIVIGVQPPNRMALGITLGALVLTSVVWFAAERRRFRGPPPALLQQATGR